MDVHPDPERHRALCQWLEANDINLNTVPIDSDFALDTLDDGSRVIRLDQFVTTPDGHKQVDPDDPNRVWIRPVALPCVVEPPADLGLS